MACHRVQFLYNHDNTLILTALEACFYSNMIESLPVDPATWVTQGSIPSGGRVEIF